MNPELAPVLDEITAVLKKHDMVGMIVIGNRTHTDFRFEIEASWTCSRLEHDSQGNIGIRVRSKLAEYPSAEAQKESLTATVGTFVTFHDTIERLKSNLETLLIAIGRTVQFEGKSTREE